MRPSLLLGAASLALMLVGSTGAEHCTTWSTSHPEVAVDGYYIDNDLCQFDGCLFSIWIYFESNGIDGLQRGDEVVDDTCHGMIESDTFPCLLFPAALMTGGRRRSRKAEYAAVAGMALLGATAFVPTVDAC